MSLILLVANFLEKQMPEYLLVAECFQKLPKSFRESLDSSVSMFNSQSDISFLSFVTGVNQILEQSPTDKLLTSEDLKLVNDELQSFKHLYWSSPELKSIKQFFEGTFGFRVEEIGASIKKTSCGVSSDIAIESLWDELLCSQNPMLQFKTNILTGISESKECFIRSEKNVQSFKNSIEVIFNYLSDKPKALKKMSNIFFRQLSNHQDHSYRQ